LAINWNATLVALNAALPSASIPDHAVGQALANSLAGAGAVYDFYTPPAPVSGTNPYFVDWLYATVRFFKELDQLSVLAEAAAGMPPLPPTEEPVLATNETLVTQYVASVRIRFTRVRAVPQLPAGMKALLTRYSQLRPPAQPSRERDGATAYPRAPNGRPYVKSYGQIETDLVTIIDEINAWLQIKGTAP